jgi:hypothetical protein
MEKAMHVSQETEYQRPKLETIVLPAEVVKIANKVENEFARKRLLKYAKFCFTKLDEATFTEKHAQRDELYDWLRDLKDPDIDKTMQQIELLALQNGSEEPIQIDIS